MQRIEFNKIYFGVNKHGYINMLFLSNQKEGCIYFDGINFYLKKGISTILGNLSLFSYNSAGSDLFIEKIAQDFDMSFIKISNGDIFQIYSMLDDEKAGQKFTIFDEETKNTLTPLGISIYEAAAKRANEADETEVIVEP